MSAPTPYSADQNIFTPSPGWIILKPWKRQAGSITLTESFQEADQVSEVVAIGDPMGSLYHPDIEITPPCAIGDVIWHATFNDTYTHLDNGIRYRAIRFDDVKAVLNVN